MHRCGMAEIMGNTKSKAGSLQLDARRLLGRGGRTLGLAAVAHARGQQPGQGPWHVLSADTIAAAEEVLSALAQQPDPALLEAAVRAAMGPKPATAAPSWAAPLWRDPMMLSRVGALFETSQLSSALGPKQTDPSDREKGLAALAVALSRSLDALRAFAEYLAEDDQDSVFRMGCLASVSVEPGEPSELRTELRRLLKENTEHG